MTPLWKSQKNDASDKRHHDALRGALSAVNGSQQRLAGTPPVAPINTASVTPKSPPTRPPPLSHASSAAILAHRQSKNQDGIGGGLRSYQTARSLANVPQHDSSPLASPSNVAATLAFARHSPRRNGRDHKIEKPLITSADGDAEDTLPLANTVKDVKRWLQNLEQHQHEAQHREKHDGARTEVRSSMTTPEAVLKSSSDRPSSSMAKAKSLSQKSEGVAVEDGSNDKVPEIHSPKPIRPMSVASTSLGIPRALPLPRNSSESQRIASSHVVSPGRRILEDVSRTDPDSRTERGRRILENYSKPSNNLESEVVPSQTTPPTVSHKPENKTTQNPIATVSPPSSLKQRPTPPPARRSQGKNKDHDNSEDITAVQPTARSEIKPYESTAFRGRSPRSIDRQVRDIAAARRSNTPNLATPTTEPIQTKRVSPHMTGDSLANAIVASSLASSKVSSPTRSSAPLFPQRANEKSRFSFHHFRSKSQSRTPSPAKGMRQTMRKQPSASEEDEPRYLRHGKKHHIRKHPNKHHEGDRKRWRDEITALERKRYEGVWAANRGLLMEERTESEGVDASNEVSNLVIRDLWKRSRLPDYILEEIWDLVDGKGTGSLGRAEFVVGFWLIDQRLKGRKLPVKVSNSIWRSARGIQGLQIPNYKHG